MARTTERVCLTLPMEFCDRLRNEYPHRDFSGLCLTLMVYADAAGFMKCLDEIDPEEWKNVLQQLGKPLPQKKGKKPSKKAVEKAVEESAEEGELETFGY